MIVFFAFAVLLTGLVIHWSLAMGAAAGLALIHGWFNKARIPLELLWLQVGAVLALPLVPWSAQRAQSRRRHELTGHQAHLQRMASELQAQLGLLRHEHDALTKDMNQLIELYRVTKETASEVQLQPLFETLTKVFSSVLSFHAWYLMLFTPANETRPVQVERAWKGMIEGGTIIAESLAPQPVWQTSVVEALHRETVPQWVEDLACIPLTFQDRARAVMVFERLPRGEFQHAQIIAHQVALQLERVLLYQELERLAISDSLTELPLRRFFLKRLDDELQRAQRHGAPGALVMLDLDHFKPLNDRYGHLVGDEVLRCTGALIKSNVREIDLIARYGGEEFVCYLVDTDLDASLLVAERIRRVIAEEAIHAYDETVRVTVSVGIALFPQHATPPAELLECADMALYQAKAAGRNQVIVYDPSR